MNGETQPQTTETPGMLPESREHKFSKFAWIIFIAVVILVLAVTVYIYSSTQVEIIDYKIPSVSQMRERAQSDNVEDLGADLSNFKLDDLGQELDSIESELP